VSAVKRHECRAPPCFATSGLEGRSTAKGNCVGSMAAPSSLQSIDFSQTRITIAMFQNRKNWFNILPMRRGLIITVIALIAFVIALLGWWCFPKRDDPLRYHLGQIHSAQKSTGFPPRNWKDYFRLRVWRWYLHGRPSFDQSRKRYQEHQKALIQMGYFEKRKFVLKRRHLDTATTKELETMLHKPPLACKDWELTTYSAPAETLWVVTTPTDMKIWSDVIARFEAKGADQESAQWQTGAN
jgi:hypothetical protein